MVSVRERIRMSEDEVAAFLAGPRKLHLATINADGSPHLVTMYYAIVEDRVAFWTYRKSQKAANIRRDPRVTCLVEDGSAYDELRGVQITGVVREVDGYDEIRSIGTRVYERYERMSPALRGYIDDQARKRAAYLVEPERVASWDHRKLAAAEGGAR
jgi:PPOX class probable F420-dependent enzyme